MSKKNICRRCQRMYYGESEICPYCDYDNSISDQNNEQKIVPSEENSEKNKLPIINLRNSQGIALSNVKEITLFLVGLIGLQILAFIIAFIGLAADQNFATSMEGSAITNFLAYGLLFIALLLILYKDLPEVLKFFKWKKYNYLIGLGLGVILVLFSIAYSSLIASFGFGDNTNQTSVVNIVVAFPISSFIFFGIIGPICEEITYRLGIYSLIAKYNKVAAYVATSIIFGLIHFSMEEATLECFINEVVNLPSYIASGLILCLAYDFGGLPGSIIAHVFNNVLAVILALIP